MIRLGTPLVALLVVLAAAAGVVAATDPGANAKRAGDAPLAHSALQVADGNGSAAVNVTVGAQLSTVIASSEAAVRTDVEDAGFAYEFERGDRAEAVAERLAELRERARELRERYREATAAVEAGEITRDEYARRVATLHDRAEQVRASLARARDRAGGLSAAEREAAGFNESRIRAIADDVDDLDGAGPRALLARFSGLERGELELRVDGGLRVEAESEDGERSREVRRPGDGSTNLTVAFDDARETAADALSAQEGNWTLREGSVHEDDGEYRFEFALRSDAETGEAEVRVDGSSGAVVRIEEEIEPREAGDDRAGDEDEGLEVRRPGDGSTNLTIGQDAALESARDALGAGNWTLVEASVDEEDGEYRFEFVRRGAGQTRTAEVRVDGSSGTVVRLEEDVEALDGEDREDGEDDAEDADEEETETEGETETEEETEGEDETETEEETETETEEGTGEPSLSVASGTAAPGATITVAVRVDGEPAADVPIEVEGEVVGSTGADGTLAVTLPDEDDVRIRAETDEGRDELRFEFDD